MTTSSAGLRRWTQRFTLASAGSFVAYLLALLAGQPRIAVLLCVFGFICPMIFGMGYLLLPPYVGRTLVDHRLPGLHFSLAYLGVGLLVVGWIADGTGLVFTLGAVAWALGVAVFLGSLLATVSPAVIADPARAFRLGDRPQRSTRVATGMLPLALGYLGWGTVRLLHSTDALGSGSTTLQGAIHVYLVGFGSLLIFALGGRLLIGFFHVSPPRVLLWLVLAAGALAPIFLGGYLWVEPWFRLGAVLGAIAMAGYVLVVTIVARRTDRRPPGLAGICLGAIAGLLAVAIVAPLPFGGGTGSAVSVHRTVILGGFFPLTIVGYAFRFFPVTAGQFPGASRRGASVTIGLLATGVALQAMGLLVAPQVVHTFGIGASLLGALGYTYLVAGRFFG